MRERLRCSMMQLTPGAVAAMNNNETQTAASNLINSWFVGIF